jgi:hypothetical protein
MNCVMVGATEITRILNKHKLPKLGISLKDLRDIAIGGGAGRLQKCLLAHKLTHKIRG